MKMKEYTLFPDEMQIQAEPGLKKSELNDILEKHGLFFGPDPASNPSIGGACPSDASTSVLSER
jgi:D-lactate dehydrogenase (cytochrome)